MLQNHYKGMNFSPNNQKKTQKKITNLPHFLVFGLVIECRNGNEAAYGERHAT